MKEHGLSFPNMCDTWGSEWFLAKLLLLKVRKWRQKWVRHRNYDPLQKKDTATIFKIDARHRISVELYGFLPRWFDLEHKFWKLWPCLFFSTAHLCFWKYWNLSQLRGPITWTKIIATPMCHTYSESWGRALSDGPTLDGSYQFKIFSNMRFNLPCFPCF